MRIKLADEDRERYSTPEWMEFDTSRPRLSEVRAIREAGFKGWGELERHLNSDDIDDRLAALAAIYWMAVRRHHDVSWDDFELDLLGVENGPVEHPNASAPIGA